MKISLEFCTECKRLTLHTHTRLSYYNDGQHSYHSTRYDKGDPAAYCTACGNFFVTRTIVAKMTPGLLQ